ncbi:MAG: ComEC/Rec2 family competence protein [Caulobacter sp.]|nr:ComEC/Rec2 family competence protein [Caulobacter sp.]
MGTRGPGWGARLSTWLSAGPSLADELAAQQVRWRLWAPVAFGFGAAGYFALGTEPAFWACALLAAVVLTVTLWLRRRAARGPLGLVLGLATLAAFGALAGKLRTEGVRAPVMADLAGTVMVEGYIVDVASPGAKGGRLLIAPVRIEGVQPQSLPYRIRVTVAPDAVLGPGLAVRLRAGLGPPPPPASPGAYDFARDAWFDRVGGVGFAVTPPMVISLKPPPLRLALLMRLNVLRWSLARRIVGRMGPESGGIAAAMITGHEAWITPQQNEAMRASGLAHILSISGLHMAIVGGFVFATVRLLVAAMPPLAVRVDGKKVAAVLGLAAIWLYLGISGAPSPAIRAAVTATVAFLAILVDRRAISLDALAVAAMIVLVLSPEAATEPGFQMSFAATAALVALAESLPSAIREIQTPWWIRLPQAAGAWLLASLAMSLVAGLATGPFAMHHFNRVASYGLIANLLVAPLSSFVMMPALAIGAALEPIGLGGPFLAAAGWSIEAMTAIAARTGQAPGALITVASGPDWTLPVAFLGILILCLWRGRLRWAGLPMALVVAFWPRPEPPDIWISSDGSAVALRQDRRAIAARPETRRFALDVWSRRRGLEIDDKAGGTLFDCNRRRCLAVGQGEIASWNQSRPPSAESLVELCRAKLVILRSVGPTPCPGRFSLDADDFRAGGSAELYRQGQGWRVVWAQPLRGRRPWTVSDTGG